MKNLLAVNHGEKPPNLFAISEKILAIFAAAGNCFRPWLHVPYM